MIMYMYVSESTRCVLLHYDKLNFHISRNIMNSACHSNFLCYLCSHTLFILLIGDVGEKIYMKLFLLLSYTVFVTCFILINNLSILYMFYIPQIYLFLKSVQKDRLAVFIKWTKI
jgi:hypothetical protein